MNTRPLVLSGPSATGKSTIVKELVAHHNFERVVPYTTRPIRVKDGEVDGVMYHFVDEPTYHSLSASQPFFMSNPFLNAWYGMGREAVTDPQSRGHRPVTEIYISVVDQFLSAFPDSDRIFIYPTNLDFIRQRMEKRGDSPQSIETRLQSAVRELACFDQGGHRHYNQVYYIDSDEENARILEAITTPAIAVAGNLLPVFQLTN
jgi:guanylate kinase